MMEAKIVQFCSNIARTAAIRSHAAVAETPTGKAAQFGSASLVRMSTLERTGSMVKIRPHNMASSSESMVSASSVEWVLVHADTVST